MNDFSEHHRVIHERVTDPNADYYEPYWWDAEIKCFVKDIPLSIKFIAKECSDEELYWLSEVFEDIFEQTRSVKLYKTIENRNKQVVSDEYRDEITECLKFASYYVKDQL